MSLYRNARSNAYTAIDATATNSSDVIEVGDCSHGSIQVNHSAHTAGSTTYEIQESNDGINWLTLSIGGSSTSTVTSGASGSTMFTMDNINSEFLRVTVTSANGTDPAPLLTPIFVCKWGSK